jgi:hypothetical protein
MLPGNVGDIQLPHRQGWAIIAAAAKSLPHGSPLFVAALLVHQWNDGHI